jgi:uncharacterized protein
MSLKKPSESEEEYFAREEAARFQRAAIEKARAMAKEEREALKAAHFMHCPKCGTELKTVALRGVSVERCFGCQGTWFDESELERVFGRDGSTLLDKIAAVFRND